MDYTWLLRAEAEHDMGKAVGIRVICPTHLRPMFYSGGVMIGSFGKVESCGCVAEEQTGNDTYSIHGLNRTVDELIYAPNEGQAVD